METTTAPIGGQASPRDGQICQSCGMPVRIAMRSVSGGPVAKPEDFETNADGSPSNKYCRYCFQNGEFTAKMEMPEFIEMQVKITIEKLGMPEEKARAMAEKTIPNLKRWKK